MAEHTVYGLMARFEHPGALLTAARQVREGGYKKYDAHSPFPIHGMDRAMGLKRSPVGYIAGLAGLTGGVFGMWLQWWTSAVDYPLVIAGKPFFSLPAFIPVAFGLTVLFAAFGAFFGMLHVNKLPHLFHGVFYTKNYPRVTDDGFFITIDADDPKFNLEQTRSFLDSLGAKEIEVMEGA